MDALELFESIAPTLAQELGDERFGELQDAMDGLDFKLALRLLRPWQDPCAQNAERAQELS